MPAKYDLWLNVNVGIWEHGLWYDNKIMIGGREYFKNININQMGNLIIAKIWVEETVAISLSCLEKKKKYRYSLIRLPLMSTITFFSFLLSISEYKFACNYLSCAHCTQRLSFNISPFMCVASYFVYSIFTFHVACHFVFNCHFSY